MLRRLVALVTCACAFSARGQTPPQSPLSLSLRVGAVVVFGDGAPAGSAPFAELATATRLSTSERPWLLLTTTQITAAAGKEFDVTRVETWRSIDVSVGLAVPLRRQWNTALLLHAGVQARAFEPDATNAPSARRAGVGVRISSTETTRLELSTVYDDAVGGVGCLLSAGADVATSIGFVGTAAVGRRGVTIKIAAVVRWNRGV